MFTIVVTLAVSKQQTLGLAEVNLLKALYVLWLIEYNQIKTAAHLDIHQPSYQVVVGYQSSTYYS